MALLLTSVLAAGCGSSGSGGSSGASGAGAGDRGGSGSAAGGASQTTTGASPDPTPEAAPVLPVSLTDDLGREVEVTSAARIVPVDGDLAEIVFALGLGDNVVATDLSATYPAEADARPEIGYQRSLAAEPILSFSPTVVLATDLAGPREVLDQIAQLVPTVYVVAPDDLTGPAAKIRAVADALGVPGRGEELARTTQAEIDAAVAQVPEGDHATRVAALYLRGDRVQQIFGPGSGMHVLLEAAGVVDVGVLLGVDDNQPVTAEALLRERPDVLIVTESGLESVGGIDGLRALPTLERTPAAENGRVLAYETQYLLGFGPRTGQLLQQLIHDLHRSD